MPTNKIIIIAGPTASGKSGFALALAEAINGIIINADSMQVYKDIPILAATPTAQEQNHIEHKLYGIYDASIRGNMVDWFNLAQQEIDQARQNNRTPIVVGGTGMYIEALEKGTTPIPETPAPIRQQIDALYQQLGLTGLYRQLQQIDPEIAVRLSPNDTTRIRRALEVWTHTHKKMSEWQQEPLCRHYDPQEFIRIYINPSRDTLNQRLRTRFDHMISLGAIEEVRALMNRNLDDSLPAMRALGVQELKAYLQHKCSLEEAIEQAKLHTRQYAKRQTTWFNHRYQPDFCFSADTADNKNFVDVIKKAL